MLNHIRRACFSALQRKDYYAILGIPNNATIDQIKEAYRSQAMKYHPDVSTVEVH